MRDFAFDEGDPRFRGLPGIGGEWGSVGGGSRTRSPREELLGNEGFASSGSSAYSWGFVTSHETDFPAEEDDSRLYSEEDSASLEDDDGTGVPTHFVRGIYQALFDFEPELETEMVMKAGDIVTVFARKCAGWVQAGRIFDGEITGEGGLVPENYLQLLERDEDDDDWEGDSDEENENDEEGANGHSRRSSVERVEEESEEASTPKPTPDEEEESVENVAKGIQKQEDN